jgi:arginyl-tRNA synthetase
MAVPIPFSGEWGTSTSFFRPRRTKRGQDSRQKCGTSKVPVPQRAQEIAEQVRAEIGSVEGVNHIEAVKGYLNVYYKTSDYARRTVEEVLASRADFGRGAPKNERDHGRIRPAEHASFVSHRALPQHSPGRSLARLVEFAGFDTIRASYPGDLGLGVITMLWIYDKFYKGQEPQGVHERGQWLLKIYVEATKLLEKKENETPEETAKREAYDAERREMYLRKWDVATMSADLWLWKTTREWSLEELRDILDMMDVKIDVWFFERRWTSQRKPSWMN